MKPVMPPGKRRRRSFGGGRVVVRRRCTKTGTSRGRPELLGASSLRGAGPISSSMPPTRSSGWHPTKWQDHSRASAYKRQIGTSSAARRRRRSTASLWEDAAHQGDAGEGLPEYWPHEGLLVLVCSFSILCIVPSS